MPEAFDALACDLARFQARHVPGYGRLCRARGVDPGSLTRAGDAPAVPTDAFKVASVFAFPPSSAQVTFRTSGTTLGQRGEHRVRDVETYDRGAVAFARRTLTAGMTAGDAPLGVAVLGPSPERAPDSSLTHMLSEFASRLGDGAPPGDVFLLQDGVLDLGRLDERCARALAAGGPPMLVCGAAFAFVHFLEGLDDVVVRLPPGSRVMQTGGFKGRSREVDGETLRRELARVFAIPPSDVVGEYGMTELSSQFYEVERGLYQEPPWARVCAVDPQTLAPVPDGTEGIARVEDLLNVDSAFALQTADLVRIHAPADGQEGKGPRHFELLGRQPGATPRGCSIALDELLGSP